MTESGVDLPSTPPDSGAAPGRSGRRKDARAVPDVCPLLQSSDGGWRSAYASRDHRCWAITPPAQLALAKQRQLCLTAGHAGCATYSAAAGAWSSPGSGSSPRVLEASLLWPAVRATPLALEPSRGRTGSRPVSPGRAGGQTLLVALMVLAFLVLVIARTATPSAQGPSSSAQGPSSSTGVPGGVVASASPREATGSPGPATSASASAVPPTPSADPEPTSSPSPASTPAPPKVTPAPTKAPTGTRRYTVQTGDTLSGIAAKFGTTVAAIRAANGIKDPRLIRVGQVLVIP
jgi:LysM repeat protein